MKKPAGVLGNKVTKKPAGKKQLSDERGCVYSRAYHSVMKSSGLKTEAQLAGQNAVYKAFGNCFPRQKAPCAM